MVLRIAVVVALMGIPLFAQDGGGPPKPEPRKWGLDVFSSGQWMISEETRLFDAPDDDEVIGDELTLQHRYRERTDFAIARTFGKNIDDQREERTRFGVRGGTEQIELSLSLRSIRNEDLSTSTFDAQSYVGWQPNDDWYWKVGAVTSDFEKTRSHGEFIHAQRAIVKDVNFLWDVGTLDIEEYSGPDVVEEKQLRYGVGIAFDELPAEHFLILGRTESDDEDVGAVFHATAGRYTQFWEQGTNVAWFATGNFDDQIMLAMGALAWGTKTQLKRNKYEMQWTSKEFFWLVTQLKHLNFEYGPAYDDITVEDGFVLSAFYFDLEVMPRVHIGEANLAAYGVWSPQTGVIDKVHVGAALESRTTMVFPEAGGIDEETEYYPSILAGVHFGKKGQWKLRFKYTPSPQYGDDAFLISLTFDLMNTER